MDMSECSFLHIPQGVALHRWQCSTYTGSGLAPRSTSPWHSGSMSTMDLADRALNKWTQCENKVSIYENRNTCTIVHL